MPVQYPNMLLGLVDKSNQADQNQKIKPELFGNKDIALMVYQAKYHHERSIQLLQGKQVVTNT